MNSEGVSEIMLVILVVVSMPVSWFAQYWCEAGLMVRVGSVGALPSSGAFPWPAHLEVTNVQGTVGEVFAIPTL